MKSFHQFYEHIQKQKALNEFGDIMGTDIGTVNLHKNFAGGLEYDFEIDGTSFNVYFRPTMFRLMGVPLHGYIVGFTGPAGYRTTGMSGSKAVGIYEHLLLATRKLLEMKANDQNEPVQFFEFTGAEPEMNLIYDKFIRRYLSNTFTRYSRSHIIRNDVIKAIQDQSPEDAPYLDMEFQQGQEDHARELEDIRQAKNARRQIELSKKRQI